MNERPKIKLELTTTDKTFEILGWVSILAIWVLTITNYTNLPDTIPIHYNGSGEADGFGGKGNILTLPLIATILFVGMTILNKFPHVFNYPTNITEDNALQQYTNATRMIRYLKFIIVVIFGLIAFQTIRNVNGQTTGLGVWCTSPLKTWNWILLIKTLKLVGLCQGENFQSKRSWQS